MKILTVSDPDAARAALKTERYDAVVAHFRLGLDFMRECARVQPDARRILLAAYADLPEIVRHRGLVARVLPENASAERIEKAIAEAPDEASVGPALPHIEELLRWTAARLAQVKGAIIRPLPPDPRALQLQFVLQAGQRLEALRQDVVKQWLWPVKPRGAKSDHPAVKLLGGASPEAEVYAQGEAYLALLPWQREKKLTAVLGVLRPEGWQLLKSIHAEAVGALAEFALPQLEEATGTGMVVPEYDWIVTPDYAGPDRRVTPTSFVNRFVFFGRRKRVPSRIARDHFTDKVPTRWFWPYLALALVDTWLTWRCVRSGIVQEANPLLRPLVLHHPWAFLVVKNALAIGAFFAVARFHLFRAGKYALPGICAAYALLDLYWAILLK